MYTVLIMSKRDMDCFERFRPLFSSSVEGGSLDACLWIESGNTIDSAVPDLSKLVMNKRSWRAVVVCAQLEESPAHPCDEDNPFDYLENVNREGVTIEDGEVVDSEVPLIRLTHLLGGIPQPELSFRGTEIVRDGEAGEPTYELGFEAENSRDFSKVARAIERWDERHALEFVPPAEIVLVKARRARVGSDELRSIVSAWKNHSEFESSLFWQRNLYPVRCRFLAFDFDGNGELRRERLCFKLWSALVTLAQADVPPSFIQAFKLYVLNVTLDEDCLEELFQRRVEELNAVHGIIARSIEEDEREAAQAPEELPSHAYSATVTTGKPRDHEIRYERGSIPLVSATSDSDFSEWDSYVLSARAEHRRMAKETKRSVDQAAGTLRERYRYPEADVIRLTEYQVEDFEESLGETYDSIIASQGSLPSARPAFGKELERADDLVRRGMARRPVAADVICLLALVVIVTVVALVPAFANGEAVLGSSLVAGSVALLLIVALVALIWFRHELRVLVRNFEGLFRQLLGRFSTDAHHYSAFLSNVGTHMRGRSYLDALARMSDEKDGAYYLKRRQLVSIERLVERLRTWSSAFHLGVRFNDVSSVRREDSFSTADYAALYSLESDVLTNAEINRSGRTIRTSLPFVKGIQIEREAIYEDA